MFRPSDDACLYPFLIPSNLFAVSVLRKIAAVHREARGDSASATDAEALAAEVDAALKAHALIDDGNGGQVWAYEIDGFGNYIFMDYRSEEHTSELQSLIRISYAVFS